MSRIDPHSYASGSQPRVKHLDWSLRVDFDTQVLRAKVALHLASPVVQNTVLDLDTRDLTIESVVDDAGRAVDFTLHDPEPILGQRLELQLQAGVRAVTVTYRTSPNASALQWLSPMQTRGGRFPYLYSQCQAIHARSIVPCQDSPAFRVTYSALIDVPRSLRAVMAAAQGDRRESDQRAVESFSMPQPIPPYLIAFAVGDIVSRDLSPRSRVWAEPEMIDAAANEFSGVELMMQSAEALFGPYDWDRFDLLVMPPSFPYGGMENPRLTFLTPTLIAGDKSLVDVVAHELAHSWTGNLVTNSTAEHFWLNEGFTVFAERRIIEAISGKENAVLSAALGRISLDEALKRFVDRPGLTRLKTDLTGIDPDEAFSEVPYEKGYLFLKTLEAHVGRAAFDTMLKKWLKTHRFQAASTDDFVALVESELPGALAAISAREWIYGEGIPPNAPQFQSERLLQIDALAARIPPKEACQHWRPVEWQLFLERIPRPAPIDLCQSLDERFNLSQSTNPEILVAWLVLACRSAYDVVLPKVEEVLGSVGRAKYLKPLYRSLCERPEKRTYALQLFERFRPRYHSVAQRMLASILTASN